jgi:acetyl esterase/lipase
MRVGIGVVFVALSMAWASAARSEPLSIESIAQHPAISGLTLSPDGKHMAALVNAPNNKWPVISIWDVENLSKPATWIPSLEMRPVAVSFLGDDRVLFIADQPLTYGTLKSFTRQAIVTDLAGKSFERPFATKGTMSDLAKEAEKFGVNFAVLQAGNLLDPNRYIVLRANIAAGTTEVLSLDTKSMKAERIGRSADNENFIVADARDGSLMVKEWLRSGADGYQLVREVRNRATGAWEEHPELGYPVRQRLALAPLGFFEADPNKLYVSTNKGVNFSQIRIYDIAARTWEAEPAFTSPQADIVGVAAEVDHEKKAMGGVVGYIAEGPAFKVVFADPYWGPIQRALEKQFGGDNVFIASRNKRLGRAIIVVSGPRRPPEYYVLLNGKELRPVGKSHPTIDPAALGETKFVRYKARDGLELPAFVTYPPGYAKERHGRIPLVVVPHGGPWSRDHLDWDSSGWTQFLATRGYAVLQPQFRGSTGWGMSLWKAGDEQWGLKMQDDNDDGVAWLVAEGVADPQRVAIFGYSYGGFAAMAAVVRPGGPFKCAISGAGVVDLSRIGFLTSENRVQREVQGWTVKGLDPLRNVDKASIPILLYHGDRDRTADTYHSRDFYAAMKAAGKDVEYHEIKDMWHRLPWWPEWHRQTLGLVENYLAGPKCFAGARAAPS